MYIKVDEPVVKNYLIIGYNKADGPAVMIQIFADLLTSILLTALFTTSSCLHITTLCAEAHFCSSTCMCVHSCVYCTELYSLHFVLGDTFIYHHRWGPNRVFPPAVHGFADDIMSCRRKKPQKFNKHFISWATYLSIHV